MLINILILLMTHILRNHVKLILRFICYLCCFKNNSPQHASLALKKKLKHKINPNCQGGQMFSNINCLNSKAKTLFATTDFDSRAHVYNIDRKIITFVEVKHLQTHVFAEAPCFDD